MSVYVVTDSTSCLPPELAAQYGITVLDIHTRGTIPVADEVDEDAESEEPKTDRDSALEKPDDEPATEQSAEGEALEAEGLAVEDNDGDASQAAQSSDSASKPSSDRISDSASDPTSDPTTAGLGPLELTAAYARLLERGGDDGVIAIHLSRELSSTWSSAVQAAAVFHGLVNVIDTRSAGMVLGQAAIAAARCAHSGGTLDECAEAAQHVIDGAEVWLYVHRLDALARGGRLSTAQRLLSTALAIKPILHLSEGKIELAAKTRTQSKAMSRLVSLAQQAYRDAATPVDGDAEKAGSVDGAGNGDGAVSAGNGDQSDVGGEAGGSSASIADITRTSDVDAPNAQEPESKNSESVAESTGDSHQLGAGDDRPRVFTFGGDHDFWLRRKREEPVPLTDLPAVPMRLDIHQAGCPEVAQELEEKLRSTLPDCVAITMVDLSPALLVHTGPVAVGITLVRD